MPRSTSAPDLRVMLAAPLQPLLSIPPAFVPQYASLSTAGALVPYKAPEVRRRPERLRATCLCLTPAAFDRSAAVRRSWAVCCDMACMVWEIMRSTVWVDRLGGVLSADAFAGAALYADARLLP
jgi:hypothetical protein